MRYVAIFLFNLFICFTGFSQESLKLVGNVYDNETSEALSGAVIGYLNKNTVTNSKGEFIAVIPKKEEIKIKISFVGYDTQTITLRCSNDTSIHIPMFHNNAIPDASITASKNRLRVFHNINAIGFDKSSLFSIPTALGEVDIMKAIQKLPGVLAIGDGRASISVRGGKMDQNQILLNGITLYNAEHMKGFVSSINPYMADSVFFYKGGFPAEYGGQLSSVISTHINDGDYYNYHGSVSVGVMSSTLHLNGPIRKGKTSFNVGARFSYIDLLLLPAFKRITKNSNSTNYFVDLKYYDITSKFSHIISPKDKLSATLYFSQDNQNDAPSSSNRNIVNGSNQNIGTISVVNQELNESHLRKWNNIAGGILWEHQSLNNFQINTRLNFSSYNKYLTDSRYNIETTTQLPNENISEKKEERYSTKLGSKIVDVSLSCDISKEINNHSLKFGGKYSINYYNPTIDVNHLLEHKQLFNNELTTTKHSSVDTLIGKKYIVNIASLYFEDTWRITNNLKGRLGLRYSISNIYQRFYLSVEPRVHFTYFLNKLIDLDLSYARMSQSSHFLSSSNILSPNDLWVPITDSIPLMNSDIISLAYKMKISKSWGLSIEGYYKWMNNLIEYKEGIYIASTTRNWEELVELGKGQAYGVELLLEKNIGSTTGWASYTWSKSLRLFDNLNGGKIFYSNDDRRHNFNITINQALGKKCDLSLSWYYQTGYRGNMPQYAVLTGSKWQEYSPLVPKLLSTQMTPPKDILPPSKFLRYSFHEGYFNRNDYKLPDNHRLDISFNFRFEYPNFSSLLNISLYNVYNQPNVTYAYLDVKDGKVSLKGITLLPFLPSLSYSLTF